MVKLSGFDIMAIDVYLLGNSMKFASEIDRIRKYSFCGVSFFVQR